MKHGIPCVEAAGTEVSSYEVEVRQLFHWVSVALGTVAGFSCGVTLTWWLCRRARLPAHRLSDFVFAGTLAHVSVPIPAGNVGAIAYAHSGRRTTLPARSALGEAIARGACVVILEVDRKVAIVQEFRV